MSPLDAVGSGLEFDLALLASFAPAFATGLLFALLLPLYGMLLQLRNEWLAALSLAQVAAAGALLALAASLPPLAGGLAASGLAASLKHRIDQRQPRAGSAFLVALLLAGWALAVLLVNNLPLAERFGRALFDGQLLLSDRQHLATALLAGVLGLPLLRLLMPALLRAHYFPASSPAAQRQQQRSTLVFDLAAALSLALATPALGVMASFALVFIPAWLACQHAPSWRHALVWSALGGAGAHLLAFALALGLDQPYGPLLALTLALPLAAHLLLRGAPR